MFIRKVMITNITCVRRDLVFFHCYWYKKSNMKIQCPYHCNWNKNTRRKCSGLIAVIGTKIPKCFLLVKNTKMKKQCPYHCNWYEYQSVQKYKMPKNQKNTMCNRIFTQCVGGTTGVISLSLYW